MSSINDESLLLEFVAESRDHLSSIEPDLLVLEREGSKTDAEIINRVFRAIHSIKGASGFFGLDALKSLSHSMENVLMMIRDGKLSPTPAIMDPLLEGVDRLRLMLDDINASEEVPFQDVASQLENLITNGGAAPIETVYLEVAHPQNTTTEKQSVFHPDRVAVDSAIRNGQKLFSIQVFVDADLSAKDRNPLQFMELLISTGNVIDTALDISGIKSLEQAMEAPMPLLFLYASVLEADLLALSLDIPESQFSPLQVSDLFEEEPKPKATPAVSAAPTPEPTGVAEKTVVNKPLLSPAFEAEPEKKTKPVAKSNTNSGDTSNESIRVKVDLLNRLMDLAGELVLARNQLTRAYESQDNKENNGMGNIIQNVDLVTSDLQEHIMQTRMQPISSVFGKFPRVVRDLSKHLNKEIELQMSGEEVELDKSILESLSDPLTHLIRNCCDHGMEMPDAREGLGKPRQGTILLKAYQESGHINIAVIDDGAGIDHERIALKALEKGLITEASLRQMSAQDQVNLIFAPGFSTAEKITDVSGRGVGMDVVRTNIEQIGGSISIETEKGKGTSILLRLPLTLAIIPSLVVQSKQQTFAVPQINLVELVCVQASQIASRIEKVGSAPVLRLRGKLLPLIKLSTVLGLDDANDTHQSLPQLGQPDHTNRRKNIHDQRLLEESPNTVSERRHESKSDYNILVLKSGNGQYGLIVDEIRDIEEIVVKPLSQFIKSCKCFSGATIMGDGRVAMILDVSGIVATSGLSFSEINEEEERRTQEAAIISGNRLHNQKQSILLFNSAANEIFAIPLSSILRLEKFKMADIEQMGHRKFLPYQGKSMALIFLDDYLPVNAVDNDLKEAYLIMPTFGDGVTGIVATAIIDAIDTSMHLDDSFIEHPGVSGSAVINNHVTLFLNPQGLLEAAGICKNHQRSEEWQADHFQPSY